MPSRFGRRNSIKIHWLMFPTKERGESRCPPQPPLCFIIILLQAGSLRFPTREEEAETTEVRGWERLWLRESDGARKRKPGISCSSSSVHGRRLWPIQWIQVERERKRSRARSEVAATTNLLSYAIATMLCNLLSHRDTKLLYKIYNFDHFWLMTLPYF